MRGLIAAFSFLTRLPLPPGWQTQESDFKGAARYFPLIGLFLGFIGVSLFSLLQPVLPGPLALILTLGAGVLLTGALHEDGFADVADACGGATAEKRREIMKDSRLGVYGGLALVFLFTFKFFAYQSLYLLSDKRLLAMFLLVPAWSRWVFLPLMASVPSAPNHQGLNRLFSAPPWWEIILSGLILLGITFKMIPSKTVPIVIAIILVVIIQAWFFRRWFGGMTGDCFGAASQWTELSILLAVNWGVS